MRVIGKSVKLNDLSVDSFGEHASPVLVLAGVHGNEIEGVWLAQALAERWKKSFTFKTGVVVFADANPDGRIAGTRVNANGIDLNRNLPSKDWSPIVLNPKYPPGPTAASEPEARALVSLIEELKPKAIISLHSFEKVQININGKNLKKVREWAESFQPLCGYPITEDIGYPTPGSLGTYAGFEKDIPTITLEILRGMPREKVVDTFIPVLEACIRFWN